MIQYILTITLFMSYIITSIVKFGIPKSISDTYYLWKMYNIGYLFNFIMVSCGFLLATVWIPAEPSKFQFLPFLACAGMMFVGTASAFKESLTKTVHFTGAYVWGIATVIWLLLVGSYESILIGLGCSLVGYLVQRNNLTFWIEMVVVIAMLIGLFNYII